MPLDYATFNELSFPSGKHTSAELRHWLSHLVQVLNEAWKMGLTRLRVRPDFRSILTSDGLSMVEVIYQLPENERDVIMSAADAPHIRDDEVAKVEEFLAITVLRVNGSVVTGTEGLLCAIVHGTLAMSFLSDSSWDCSFVKIVVCRDGFDGEKEFIVRHASRKEHLITHSAKVGELTFDPRLLVATAKNPLPNSVFASRYIANGDWQPLIAGIMAKAGGEKIAAIADLANAVAKANGYVAEAKLSSHNQKRTSSLRKIFSTGEGDARIYLSTDFKKCTFEVCDSNGRHLGELNFSGVLHQGADTSGGHDIEII